MTNFWDRLGISASLVCAVHCILTPFLVLAMPIAGEFLSEAWFHSIIAVIVFPVALWALWNGYKKHHDQSVLWLGGIGLSLMAIGLEFPYITSTPIEESHQNPWSIFTMVVAGLTLAYAHYRNLRSCNHSNHNS